MDPGCTWSAPSSGADDAGTWQWINGELRARLEAWFGRWYRAETDELADRVVLQLVRASRRSRLDATSLGKLA